LEALWVNNVFIIDQLLEAGTDTLRLSGRFLRFLTMILKTIKELVFKCIEKNQIPSHKTASSLLNLA
jgi:hypothetical protein